MIITEHMFLINAQFHIEFRQNVVFVWLTKRALILRKGNLVKNVRQLKGAALSKVPPLAIRYRAG